MNTKDLTKKIVPLACGGLLAVVPVAGARAESHSPKPRTTVSGLDKEYLTTSMQGDRFEIRGGKLAESRSHSPAVLRLAHRLVTDHAKSLHEDAALARKLHVSVPGSPTPSELWELQSVSALHGRAFDHWYSSLEVYDHMQDIQETSDEVSDGSSAQVRKDARAELPVLRKHLRLARKALAASPRK